MRKIFVLGMLVLMGPMRPAFAESNLSDQFSASLFQHGVAATEFTTEGTTKLLLLLTPFQAGHYKGDYVLGQDAGIIQNSVDGTRVGATAGIHVHLISLIRNLATDSTLLDDLDATPRVAFDSDVHKIVYSYMVGFEKKF